MNPGPYKYLIESKFGSDYEFDNHSGEMIYHCPYCLELGKRNDDYKLYINSYKGVYNCFRCGTSGRLVLDSDTKLITHQLGNLSELVDLFMNNEFKKSKSSDVLFMKLPSYELYKYPDTLAYQYMISRGITCTLMKQYNIRAFGDDKLTKGRVILPNKIINKDWTDFYTARSIVDSVKPKYLNSDVVPKSEVVFNLHMINEGSDIIINEGIINSYLQ